MIEPIKVPNWSLIVDSKTKFALPLPPSSKRQESTLTSPALSVYVPTAPKSPIFAVCGIAVVVAETGYPGTVYLLTGGVLFSQT